VISDCRFPNEIASIKRAGGQIIWVQRGLLPDWYGMAFLANGGDSHNQEQLRSLKIHASETAWVGPEFDHIIDNGGSIGQLYDQVKNLVLNPLDSRGALPDEGFVDSSRILSSGC